MSTPLTTNPTTPLPTAAQPVFQRFLWKEYRMLRGFWLAVGGLAMIVQAVVPQLLFDPRVATDQVFAIAWGAAALYAVGAAITLFSAEQEEQTRDFLMLLPGHWLSMFLSKIAFALLSAIALAVALSLAGALMSGGTFPTRLVMTETLAVVGVAIIEAMAWGLLFSLWMKQPLLAAIVSIAAASLGAQLAVAMTWRAGPVFTTSDYGAAVPTRLLICLGVFLVDVWLASFWLTPAARPGYTLRKRRLATRRGATCASSTHATPIDASTGCLRRRRILGRLLWQTWRTTWPSILLAVPIAMMLMAAIFASSWLGGTPEIALLLCPLLLPALFGALVFRADQRSGHRLFLATHAVRPRYVWLSRQLVWLAALTLLGILLQVVSGLLTATGLHENLQGFLRNQRYAQHYQPSAWSTAWQLQIALTAFWSITTVGWSALFAAYGIGQLCSMLLSREVLAGFLSLLLAAGLTGWAIVVGIWELNPAWFVLPIGLLAMAATWYRAPDWIIGRNGPRAWMAPLLTMLLPLGLIASTLPTARLDQIALHPSARLNNFYNFMHKPLSSSLLELEASQVAARETATTYEQLHAAIVPWEVAIETVVVDGKRYEDLDFLLDDLYHDQLMRSGSDGMGRVYEGHGGIRFTTEHKAILSRFDRGRERAFVEANQAIITALDAMSLRPAADIPETALTATHSELWGPQGTFEDLLLGDASQLLAQNRLHSAMKRFATVARLRGQLLSRKTATELRTLYEWQQEKNNLEPAILTWAQHPDQTSQNLREAIRNLQKVYQSYPRIREAVLADYSLIRDVLIDKQPASFLEDEHQTWTDYLPYLANKLGWERERALRALDLLTELRLNYLDRAAALLEDPGLRDATNRIRHDFAELLRNPNTQSDEIMIESIYRFNWNAYIATQKYHQVCRTSFLLRDELSRRVDLPRFLVAAIDGEIGRRGLLIQLALIAHRLDHDQYPDSLAELAPDYLTEVPLDPYSQEAFEYHPAGLTAPLLRKNFSNGQPLETLVAGTPFFWSVGTANFVLEKQLADDPDDTDDTDDTNDINENNEPEQHKAKGGRPQSEIVYRFQPRGAYWHFGSQLVFPLPVD